MWLAEPIADVAAVTMTTTLFRRQFKTAMEQLTTVKAEEAERRAREAEYVEFEVVNANEKEE